MARNSSSQLVASVVAAGEMLEAVRTRTGAPALVRWNGGRLSYGREFRIGTHTYVAADSGSGLPREIRLARRPQDYVSDEVLLSEIAAVLRSRGGVSESDAEFAAYFAVATHFADCHDPALRAVISATDEWEAARFLRLLACFCRHAFPVATFDLAHLWQLPYGCVPTFLISDPEPSNSLTTLLNATQHQGFALARAGQTFSRPFSAIIIDCNGMAPTSFGRIDATPRTQPAIPNAEALTAIEERFQAKLLSYRLRSRSQVAGATYDASALGGSFRAMACVLGSCFPNNPTLQARISELLQPQDEDRRFDSACGEAAVVLEALLVLCHQNRKDAHVGDVAKVANGILELRGDGYQLDPRRVGALLKPFRLGHTRDSRGYKFLLSAGNQRKIHELGRSRDVSFFKDAIGQCNFCRDSASALPAADPANPSAGDNGLPQIFTNILDGIAPVCAPRMGRAAQ
jgi:hypothetical protein